MVADRIFRHIPYDRLEFEMTAKNWNYLITMTAGIQNVISSAGDYEIRKQHSNVIRLLVLAHLNDIQTFDI